MNHKRKRKIYLDDETRKHLIEIIKDLIAGLIVLVFCFGFGIAIASLIIGYIGMGLNKLMIKEKVRE